MEHLVQTKNRFVAVAGIRVSSMKQGLVGDSHERQLDAIELKAKELDARIIKVFKITQSASGIVQPMQEAVDYCKQNAGKIDYFIVKSLDRFTRAGPYYYANLKEQLSRYGVTLVDTNGIVSGTTVDTMANTGFSYTWSVISPNETAEYVEAGNSKREINTIMTRMIGAEIGYSQMGFIVRQSNFGYMSTKVDTPHGRRTVLIPHPVEGVWLRKMFELRAPGNLTDEEIVEEINKLGYKSRKRRVHEKKGSLKIIGYSGGLKLTVKQMLTYIQNPIYAGIVMEKWTHGLPVKGMFEGLVGIELFNKANRGKITIQEDGTRFMYSKVPYRSGELPRVKIIPHTPIKHMFCVLNVGNHCWQVLPGVNRVNTFLGITVIGGIILA